MDPRKLFVDERQTGYCVYCGGPTETADHVPSKAFLDEPYPANLPTVSACRHCNQGFSLDEEYLACFVECTLVGSTDPMRQRRVSIGRKLTDRPSLRARIEASRASTLEGSPTWHPDVGRVENVLTKLARGHIAFEEGTPRLDEPGGLDYVPLPSLTPAEAHELVGPWPDQQTWPEIGSRAFFRASGIRVPHNPNRDGWITIQENRYRYRTHADTVQIVLSDYLACTVLWG